MSIAAAVLAVPAGCDQGSDTALRDRVETVGVVDAAWTVAGSIDDPTVVLVHGVATNRFEFTEVVEALANTHHVIAIDLPGFGTSSWRQSETTVDALAAATTDVLDHLDLDDVTIAVTDLGYVALDWVSRFPDRVDSIVMFEAPLFPRESTPPGRADIDPSVLIDPGLQLGTVRTLPEREIEPFRTSFSDQADLVRDLMQQPASPTSEGMWFTTLKERSSDLTVVVADPGSAAEPAELRAAVLETYPGSTVVEFGPGVHLLALDNPSRLAELITGVIES